MIEKSFFNPIECGETLPQNNIHAVSTSMPKLQDVIDYEEQTPEILEKISVAYPRFVIHPYLKKLSSYLKEKYKISDEYELILLSSKKAVDVVSNRYYIHNICEFNEPFGVIKVLKGRQYKKVLKFIQDNDLGGGDWGNCGDLFNQKFEKIGHISYNGVIKFI